MDDFIVRDSKMNELGFVDATWQELISSKGDMVATKRKKHVYRNNRNRVIESSVKMQRPAASYSNTQWGDITENDL